MRLIEADTGIGKSCVVEPISVGELRRVSKSRYFFNWKTETEHAVFKLMLSTDDDILGLISLINVPEEHRIEISLLTVSRENRGKNKQYEGIAGNLIAFACREAVRLYAENACVSLFPKTELKAYYIKAYGMLDAGRQIFLEGEAMISFLKRYDR